MTNEEWIRHAVEQLNSSLFSGDLDLLNHQFQISWGRCKGNKMTECIQPYDGEDVNLDDFFPTTITISFTIKDPIELLGNLALECIHAFFNEKGNTKRFKKLAEKYYFEKPYKSYNPSPYLKDIINEVYEKMCKEYGKFPGQSIVFHKNEQKERKKSFYTMFCPTCGYEAKVSSKTLMKYGNKTLTCICGSHMGIDLEEDEEASAIQDS